MKDSRFDVRSRAQFAADIKHATAIEGYIFKRWAAVAHETSPIRVLSYRSNGCDNTGEYLPTGTDTSGADFYATIDRPDCRVDLPVEVKLAPLHGFLTLKERDLAAYSREGAAILFVMPMLPSADVRMGGTVEQRVAVLEGTRLEWGIMWPEVVNRVVGMPMEPQRCFGGKRGVRLYREDYNKYFRTYQMGGVACRG